MFKESGTQIWKSIKKEISIWRQAALPGFAVTTIVVIARLNGLLQPLEWMALDNLFRLRPAEPIDNRITIIGINEDDIKKVGTYPIPDREIAVLINKVQSYQPKVIGLDLVRNVPIEPGSQELANVLKKSENLIAIEKVLPTEYPPPPNIPPNRIGFSDVLVDTDGNTRRLLLGTPSKNGYKFSLSLRLAETYLSTKGISLKNGIHDPDAMRFAEVEIPRVFPNTGGYVGTDAGGVQTLLNWRSGEEPFQTLSLNDIKTAKFEPNLLRSRIVLIGMTAPSVSDYVNTNAVIGLKPYNHIYGVKFHAQATSQIISAVLDKRPLLRAWSDGWEYLWIISWGIISIIIGRLTQSAFKNLIVTGITSFILIGTSYLFFLQGLWIPVAPNLLILAINGVGLSAFAFYQRDRALQSQIEERQRAIENTFTYIHNGPLQTLANTLRCIQEEGFPKDKIYSQLTRLNQEIRNVGEHLKSESLNEEESLFLVSGLKLNLKLPLHELLYEVYTSTLKRDLPHFENLKLKARSFDPIDEQQLNTEQKRELCQFLEEALCNVGKHAIGAKRIQATGKGSDGKYTLSIKDNGCGINSNLENKGTKQAVNLAKKLRGSFKREPITPRGTLCELTWPIKKHLLPTLPTQNKAPRT
ncbi:possible Sensor with Chase2 domain [Rivularia sp. IAM M-261]|nr:possible Sensor with Chase2 domain [Rivularia sp. IAM M-261]